jgi:20S proteasome alpha/beta subunit
MASEHSCRGIDRYLMTRPGRIDSTVRTFKTLVHERRFYDDRRPYIIMLVIAGYSMGEYIAPVQKPSATS